MKTFARNSRKQQGNTLLLTLVMTGLIGFLLASYLTLVRSQNASTMRSQSWNSTIPVIEAGIEEALTHLYKHGDDPSLHSQGWQKLAGVNVYALRRDLGRDQYEVTISNWVSGAPLQGPIIESRGYVVAPAVLTKAGGPMFAAAGTPAPAQVVRGVRANTRRAALFGKGMVVNGTMDLGAGTYIDSFDSADTNKSTNGKWDIAKRGDNGSIATNSKDPGALDLNGADVYGNISTGPGGTPVVGGGSVGDKAWVDGGSTGVQDGHYVDDMNVEFDPVEVPFTGGASLPEPGVVNGVPYDMVLKDGVNYQVQSVRNKKIIATGKAVLYVRDSFEQNGQAVVEVATTGSLKLYVGGKVDIGGNGIVNQTAKAENFMLFGLPTCTNIKFHGNGTFSGAIYAPNADLTLSGGGSGDGDFSGASVTKSVTFNGHFKFHYDEALGRMGMGKGYVLTSWNEMTPKEVSTKFSF
jgi:hypothetical protein